MADDFVARARDLEEGPGMKSDDVDYMAAKVRRWEIVRREVEATSFTVPYACKRLMIGDILSNTLFGDTLSISHHPTQE